MSYDLASTSWGQEELDAHPARPPQRPLHDGRAGAPLRGGVRREVRHEARGHGQLRIVGESRRRRGAVLQARPSAPARRRSHRPGDLVGDDVSSAAAVRPEAALRRRRARHAEHGRLAARGGADAADAHGRGGQHPRQSGGARRHARVLRRARPVFSSRTTASRWAPA